MRLDLQVVYRPDAVLRTSVSPNRWIWKVGQAYKWQRAEHINLLELRAILCERSSGEPALPPSIAAGSCTCRTVRYAWQC